MVQLFMVPVFTGPFSLNGITNTVVFRGIALCIFKFGSDNQFAAPAKKRFGGIVTWLPCSFVAHRVSLYFFDLGSLPARRSPHIMEMVRITCNTFVRIGLIANTSQAALVR